MISYSIQKKWKYLSPIITRIPNKILEFMARIYIKLQDRELIGEKIPKRIIFFVTNRCNLRCKHCFYIPHTSPAKEMSLSQIQQIASSARNNIQQVIFTGGEPFVRDDLLEIVLSFAENGCKTANIITNGILTEKVHLFLEKIVKKTKIKLIFMVSVDGPETIHDNIRRFPGALEKTLKTITLLSNYYQQYPSRFNSVYISTSINRLNLTHLPETIEQIKSFKNVAHLFNFTRSANLHTFDVPKDCLSGFDVDKNIILNIDEMKNVFKYLDKKVWNTRNNSLLTLANRQVLIEIIRLLERKNTEFNCSAGTSEVIIYPEGDVGICEMLKSVDNLKNTNYNLIKFYQKRKEKFQANRKCSCTHDCNVMSSIRLTPKSLVEMIKRK